MSKETLDLLANKFKERYFPAIGIIRKSLAFDPSGSRSKNGKMMQENFGELLYVFESLALKFPDVDTSPQRIESFLNNLETACAEKAARFAGFDQSNPTIMGKQDICINAAVACEVLKREWIGEREKNLTPLIRAIDEQELAARARDLQALPAIKDMIIKKSKLCFLGSSTEGFENLGIDLGRNHSSAQIAGPLPS